MREQQRELTRRRLYTAALQVFVREGVAQSRIESIADLAGVSRAAFYFHYPSKEDVLLQLLEESERPAADALRALPIGSSLEEVFECFESSMANFWSVDGRGRLLTDIFATSLRRTEVVRDRAASPVHEEVARRFDEAAAAGVLSNSLPASTLADFYLLNTLAAMAAWGSQSHGALGEALRGVRKIYLHGALRLSGGS